MIRTTADREWSAPPWRTASAPAAVVVAAVATSVVVRFAASRVHLPAPTEVPPLVAAAGRVAVCR